VTYDVSPDAIRTRVAHVLERYGWRVQESVFECVLEGHDLSRLTEALRETLGRPENGSVRIYRLCAECHRTSFGLGAILQPGDAEPCIVV